MPDAIQVNDYDSEPVRYCARCYSLKVKYDEEMESEYCDECGSSDILELPFEAWEKKYEQRYGHKFAVKTEDPKKTFIFNLSVEDLKKKVCNSDKWKEIIKSMYPSFPGGLTKAEAIILFFHTIIKENKLTDLKFLLLKLFKY